MEWTGRMQNIFYVIILFYQFTVNVCIYYFIVDISFFCSQNESLALNYYSKIKFVKIKYRICLFLIFKICVTLYETAFKKE